MLVIMLASCALEESTEKPFTYSNVLVILADDHSKYASGFRNHDLVQTPNLDSLFRSSLSFSRAYCNSPICNASRQSMLTGKLPHATGVSLLFTPFNDVNNQTIAEHLKDHEFRTGLIGKSHFNSWIWGDIYEDNLPTFGFDTIIDTGDYRRKIQKESIPEKIATQADYESRDFHSIWNTSYLPADCYEKDCRGTFLNDQAIQFLHRNKDNRFFLWYAPHEPHAPFDFPVEFVNRIDTSRIEIPSHSTLDERWIPEIFKQFSPGEKKGAIASYLTSVEYLDSSLGKLFAALKDLGLTDNTLVVYASDNGYLLYDHGRLEKHTMWEQSISVPLLFNGSTIKAGVSQSLFSMTDLAGTLVDALGVDRMKGSTGISHWNSITIGAGDHREYVFAEYLEDNLLMMVSDEWKYVFHTGKRDLGLEYKTGNEPSGIQEWLFDLTNDPGETENKILQNTEVAVELREAMLLQLMETHPDAINLPAGLTTLGKLAWFAEPRDVGADVGGIPLPVRKN